MSTTIYDEGHLLKCCPIFKKCFHCLWEVFIHKLSSFLAKGLGTGLIPFMPGTWGSLLGVVFVYFWGHSWFHTLGVFLFSWLVIWHYEKQSQSHDESQVVIDEIAGIYMTFLFAPINLPILAAGFLLFRFFDIVKPFPIGWVDKNWNSSFGTLFDDVIAGAMSCLCLQIIVYYQWL